LLAGIGALAIPGLGPFIAAGPIMGVLAGLGAGAATGLALEAGTFPAGAGGFEAGAFTVEVAAALPDDPESTELRWCRSRIVSTSERTMKPMNAPVSNPAIGLRLAMAKKIVTSKGRSK